MAAELSLISARFAVYATVLAAFGIAFFHTQGRPGASTDVGAPPLPRKVLVALAVLAIASSIAQILAMAASMTGVGIGEVDPQTVTDLIGGTAVGYAWLARVVALILLGFAATGMPRAPRTMLVITSISSGVAATTLAWTGHGAMDDGGIGWVHLCVDILHLLAAAAWLGAIVSLFLLVRPGTANRAEQVAFAHDALRRFGLTGTMLVGVIVATGIANMWLLVGWSRLLSLGEDDYGRLLIAKLALFVAMLGLAAANRFRLTPALAQSIATYKAVAPLAALRRSLAAETLCAIVIFALIAWLGTLSPPAAAM